MTLRKRSLPEEVRSMEGVGDTLTAARNTMQTKAHSCVPQRAQRVSDGEPLKRRSTVWLHRGQRKTRCIMAAQKENQSTPLTSIHRTPGSGQLGANTTMTAPPRNTTANNAALKR